MQHFSKLQVWQRSHELVLSIYRATLSFPAGERFGLVSQLRRAAASVPTNIAEGSKRQGSHDYARFLNIAEGSLAETEYLLVLTRDLGYLAKAKAEPCLAEVSEIARMLYALRTKVEAAHAA
jgi:four helix bundle protein